MDGLETDFLSFRHVRLTSGNDAPLTKVYLKSREICIAQVNNDFMFLQSEGVAIGNVVCVDNTNHLGLKIHSGPCTTDPTVFVALEGSLSIFKFLKENWFLS